MLTVTNQVLDPAIIRPGRFDSHFYLGLPNDAARKEIFDMKTKGRPVEESFNVNELVRMTEGYSGAEIVQICDMAKLRAAERRMGITAAERILITQNDFEQAQKLTSKGVTPEMIAGFERFGSP